MDFRVLIDESGTVADPPSDDCVVSLICRDSTPSIAVQGNRFCGRSDQWIFEEIQKLDLHMEPRN